MDVRLYINGQEVEIDGNVIAPLTYSISDVKQPEKRARNRSKTIKIKGTQRNLNIFANAYRLSVDKIEESNNFNPNTEVTARITRDGYVVFNGVCNFLNTELENEIYSFNIEIYGNSVSLFDKLGDRTIAELGWSEYDHELSVSNIENSWDTSVDVNGTPTSNFTGGVPDGFGYIYGMANYGYAADQLVLKTNEILPLIYFKEVFEKAFDVGGYTVTGDWIDDEITKRIVIGGTGGERVGLSAAQIQARLVDYTIAGASVVNIPPYTVYAPFAYRQYFYSLGYSTKIGDISPYTTTLVDDDSSQFTESNGKLTIASTGYYRLSYSFNLSVVVAFTSGSNYNFSGYIAISIRRNGAAIKTVLINTPYGNSMPSFNAVTEALLYAGDIIDYNVTFYVDGANTINITGVTDPIPVLQYNHAVNSGSIGIEAINESIIDGDTVKLANYIPEMKAKDFMLDAITMFNLYIGEPNDDNEIEVEPYVDYYNTTNTAENWTNKLDHSKKQIISSNAGIEGKTYKFKFKQDEDAWAKYYRQRWGTNYGDYQHNVSSSFKKGEKEYKIGFAQSIPINVDGLTIPQIVSRDEMTNIESPYKGSPRIFLYNGLKTGDWTLINTNTLASNAQTEYPQLHHVDDVANPTFDLNFGVPIEIYYTTSAYTTNNLYGAYYKRMIDELTSPNAKFLTAYFRIDESDLQGDFFKNLVNINGVVYRKNIISDFDATGNETTKVELLKVLDSDAPKFFSLPIPDGTTSQAASRLSNQPNNKSTIVNTSQSWDESLGNLIVLSTNTSSVNLTLPLTARDGAEITVLRFGSNTASVLQESDTPISGLSSVVMNSDWDSHTFIYSSGVWALKYKSDTYYRTLTSNYTLGINDTIVFCDTSAGTFTLTLPSTPSDKTRIIIKDNAQTFKINPLIINPNGKSIEGRADNMKIDITKASFELYYKGTGTNQEWKII